MKLEEDLRQRAEQGDRSAKRKLFILADDQFNDLVKKSKSGDKDALNKLKMLLKDFKERASGGDNEAAIKAGVIEQL